MTRVRTAGEVESPAARLGKNPPDLSVGSCQEEYAEHHAKCGLPLGLVQFVTVEPGDDPVVVANAITQQNTATYRGERMVDYDAVRKCFKAVAAYAKKTGLPVHYPKIGAGLAGGDWKVLDRIIQEELAEAGGTLWVPRQ